MTLRVHCLAMQCMACVRKCNDLSNHRTAESHTCASIDADDDVKIFRVTFLQLALLIRLSVKVANNL